MAFVHRGAVTRCLRIDFAHVGSFFGVPVIVCPREVIHTGTRIYPNNNITRTVGACLLIGRELGGAHGSWQ